MYKDGTVCISILHPPGDDPNHYESSSERWSPVQSVEKTEITKSETKIEARINEGTEPPDAEDTGTSDQIGKDGSP